MLAQLTLALVLTLTASSPSWAAKDYRRHIGIWTLRVHADPFTGTEGCRLSANQIEYRGKALVFHLPRASDTFDAVYRIDTAAPRSVHYDAQTLALMGFPLHNDQLENPSGGVVRIPVDRLGDAHQVMIEDKPGGVVRRFNVEALSQAVAAAGTAGCAADAFN